MGARIAVVSTFPPTQCGIATFAQSLVTQLRTAGADVRVIPIVEGTAAGSAVSPQWRKGDASSTAAVAATLDDVDVVLLQHEYGIFGGTDGEDVLDLLDQVRAPVVTVLHTVLVHPTLNQRRIVEGLVAGSAALVTMTEVGRSRLETIWGVDPSRVTVIPHGAVDNRSGPTFKGLRSRQTVLTWGLLSPGKGIEWALLALAELRGSIELPNYRVLGRTHPHVVKRDGEAYRDSLVALTRELHLEDRVFFDDRYLASDALRHIVRRADVVLLPYDSREQVTSGVLTEAVAAGRPVISTSFPHAVELLSGGAGLLVPQDDYRSIAAALRTVLTDSRKAQEMARVACSTAETMLWPRVARAYLHLARSILFAPPQATV